MNSSSLHPFHFGAEAHPHFLSFSPAAQGSPAPEAGTAVQPHEPLASGSWRRPEAHERIHPAAGDVQTSFMEPVP